MNDHSHGAYGNWPRTGTQWVELTWSHPIATRKIDVYWWDDNQGVRLPRACRLLYWDGSRFVPVRAAAGLGVAGGRYNTTTFAEVTSKKLRLEFDGNGQFSTGIIEWKVYDSGKSPAFAPRLTAGPDRSLVLPAKTYLNARIKGVAQSIAWSKASGPGTVTFADPHALRTTAEFFLPGDYVLNLAAANKDQAAVAALAVRVEAPCRQRRLDPVAVQTYRIDSPLWSKRLKQLIVNWIPHCVAELSKPRLPEGGLDNFIEAGNRLAGRRFKPHIGPPWADAYTLTTVESICLALMLDPQGDAELLRAQTALRERSTSGFRSSCLHRKRTATCKRDSPSARGTTRPGRRRDGPGSASTKATWPAAFSKPPSHITG